MLNEIKINKSIWLFILVWCVAFIVSAIAIGDTFLSDEYEFIHAAAGINNWHDFWRVVTSKIGGEFYRPVLYFSFIIDFWLYGLREWGYHLTNSILQATNSLLLSLLVWRFGKMYFNEESVSSKKSRLFFVSIITGLLFAVFPNHHESVTWLAARTGLLATTWYLAALLTGLLYLKKINTWIQQRLIKKTALIKQLMLIMLLCLLSALAYFTKEESVTLIIILMALGIWHAWRLRKQYDTQKWWINLIFALAPLLAIFIFYLVVRKNIVGYWFGGYMISGTSEFLSINLDAIKNWLLIPKNLVLYLVNHAYLYHILTIKLPQLTFQSYILLMKGVVYSLGATIVVAAIWVTVYRRRWRVLLFATLPAIIFMYVTAIPTIGILHTINPALESTRFFYLPSAGICILMALWLSLWKKIWLYLLTSIIITIMSVLYIFNYQPWSLAQASSQSIQQAIIERKSELQNDDWVYIINTPDNLYGAYVFRRGLPQMFNLLQPGVNMNRVIISGRGVIGTFTPECILTQSEKSWLMVLDGKTGFVKSFTHLTHPDTKPTINLQVAEQVFELHDIEHLKDNMYQVTNNQPYILLKNLQINPQEIASLRMTIIPEHQYLMVPQHIYWTTTTEPNYHEYYRHIWRFFGILLDSEPSQRVKIYVCQYPSFVFSDTIQDVKITLPFKIDEKFILK